MKNMKNLNKELTSDDEFILSMIAKKGNFLRAGPDIVGRGIAHYEALASLNRLLLHDLVVMNARGQFAPIDFKKENMPKIPAAKPYLNMTTDQEFYDALDKIYD